MIELNNVFCKNSIYGQSMTSTVLGITKSLKYYNHLELT